MTDRGCAPRRIPSTMRGLLSGVIFLTWLPAALVVFGGCGDPGAVPNGPQAPGPLASSPYGMVVTGSDPATRAGVEILEAGGNAVDAATAAAFALAVTEPSQSGLGGRTQILVGTPDGAFRGIDATNGVPEGYDARSAPEEDFGFGVIGVPGTVAGLAWAHGEWGALPWPRVLEPAVRLAAGGFPLSPGEAMRLASAAEQMRGQSGARHFLRPDGAALQAGDELIQSDLARVLEAIALEGAEVFYRGEIARRMAEDMADHQGHVTLPDLEAYEPRSSIVVQGRYRNFTVVGTYLPASGATVIEVLHIMEAFHLPTASLEEWTAVVTQALLLGFADRTDRGSSAESHAARLVDPAWAAERAREVRLPESGHPRPTAASRPGDPALIGARTVSGFPGRASRDVRRVAEEPGHTTHLSVVDREGMIVSQTQSLGPTMGSRVVTPGLGFLYATTLGGYLSDVEPGERPWSSQSPLILLTDGRPAYVLGAAGGRRIVSALVQVISRMADQGLSLEEAMAAPRFHVTEGTVILEKAEGGKGLDSLRGGRRAPGPWPDAVRTAMEELGFVVQARDPGEYFARVNAIEIRTDEEGHLGVADPRWRWGAALGPGR